jgi:hypothetical protein
MAIRTSGTTDFNLPFNEMAEEAYERCGIEMRTGYQLRTARRSLNLMTMEWANRGINLWTIEEGEIPLVTGQVAYPLPDDTIDLLDHVIRQNQGTVNQIDINITRISSTTYLQVPNKLAQGRPIQLFINRQTAQTNPTTAVLVGNGTTANISATDTTIQVNSTADLGASGYIQIDNETIYYTNILGNLLQLCARGQNGTTAAAHTAGAAILTKNLNSVSVWPTPDAGGSPYTLVYWRMRRIQDAGGGTSVQDVPFRLVPALVAGLAYHLAVKNPEALDKVSLLKQMYDEAWLTASTEDREKASLRLAPRQLFW